MLHGGAAGGQQPQARTEGGGRDPPRPDLGHHAEWGTKDPRMAIRYVYFRAARSAAWLNASVMLVGTPNAMPPLKPKPSVTGCLSGVLLSSARMRSCPPGEDRSRDALNLSSPGGQRSEEHTSELQSRLHLVCRLLLEKKKSSYTVIHSDRSN